MSDILNDTVTRDDLRRATEAIKEPSFSSVNLYDQYEAYARASADAAESQSNDSDRFSMFVNTMKNLLRVSGTEWGGTIFGYAYSGSNWWVASGDTPSPFIAKIQIEGRFYLCTTVGPR